METMYTGIDMYNGNNVYCFLACHQDDSSIPKLLRYVYTILNLLCWKGLSVSFSLVRLLYHFFSM